MKLNEVQIKAIKEEYYSHVAAGEDIRNMVKEYKFKHYTVFFCEGKAPGVCEYCKRYFSLPSVRACKTSRAKKQAKTASRSVHA